MAEDKPKSKTAIERECKEVQMERILIALNEGGIPVERVNDFGTLAYMIGDGQLEGRFITIKVVLTKEFSEETGLGFDMDEAISEYEETVKQRTEAASANLKKALAKELKKVKK